MSSSAVVQVIKSTFAAGWDAASVRIRETNTEFDPEGNPWVELRFPGSQVVRGDIGEPDAPLQDEVGAFMVDIYVPHGVGDDLARELADAAWSIFAMKDISGIRFDSRLTGQSGDREPVGIPGVWWGLSFGISYRYQSV